MRNEGLPDPEGALACVIPSKAIEQANWEVLAVTQEEHVKKRGPYHRFTPKRRAAIGKYASKNGMAAAARYFPRQLN